MRIGFTLGVCNVEVQAQQPIDGLAAIGRYRLVSELGRGAMARVYLAQDPNIDRKIALKVLTPLAGVDERTSSELHRRFLLEARAAGNLRHSAAVAIYDADHDAATGLFYIAMEWIDGESLDRELERGSPLAIGRAVTIARQVAGALDAAHRQGLVHRDVKPANILLDREGRAKLSDFGIAKLGGLALTHTGQVLGTPYYMSPEQLRGEPLDGRSDLFSLGVVMYECLTGSRPFAGESLASITYKIVNVDPRPPQVLNPRLSDGLAATISRALAKRPDRRFRTAAELIEALTDVLEPAPAIASRGRVATVCGARPRAAAPTVVLAPPPPKPDHRVVQPRRLAGGLALTAAAVGLLTWAWMQGVDGPAEEASPRQPSVADRAAAAKPAAEPAAAALVPGEARLEIVYTNRLKRGSIAVWVDGEKVLARSFTGPKGVLKRAVGQELRDTLTLATGRHEIEVHVSGQAGKLEARDRTSHRFFDGQTRRLRIDFIPPSFLRLAWKEASDD